MALYDIYALSGRRKDKGVLAFNGFRSRKEGSIMVRSDPLRGRSDCEIWQRR